MGDFSEAFQEYYADLFGQGELDKRQEEITKIRIHMAGPGNNPIEIFGTDDQTNVAEIVMEASCRDEGKIGLVRRWMREVRASRKTGD